MKLRNVHENAGRRVVNIRVRYIFSSTRTIILYGFTFQEVLEEEMIIATSELRGDPDP